MTVREAAFPSSSFFNSSINASSLEDVVAITELYFEHDRVPDRFVFELDPWFLDARTPYARWKPFKREYLRAIQRFHLRDKRARWLPYRLALPEKYIAAFSFSYFQVSLRNWLSTMRSPRADDIAATDQEQSTSVVRRHDGSISYSQQARAMSASEVAQLARRFANGGTVDYFDGYTQLDENLSRVLEDFVAALQRKNVEVVFFLAPFHPYVYAKFSASEKYGVLARSEAFYRAVAARNGIPVYGSYDPGPSRCTEEEFYDAIHAKESCIQRIFLESKVAVLP
jgi:hypothetical protein